MFNKNAPFPKGVDPQPLRAPRPGPGAFAPTPGTGLPGSAGESPQSHPVNAGSTPSQPASPAASRMPGENEAAQDVGSRLIVGPDVKLKGAQILDCETLIVEGRVEATMDSRVIRIAETGAFAGTVGIDVAEVWGRFDGELTARSQLIIHSTGRVSGKIRYGKILIEQGGEICGDVQSLAAAGTEMRPAPKEEPPKVAAVAAAG